MRVVVDTNVLVSGLLSAGGPPAWIVEALLAGELELALDMAIRQAYEDVLRRPEFAFSAENIDDLLATIDQFGFHVAAVPPCSVPLPDPDDEPFLAVAPATDGTLVTGNVKFDRRPPVHDVERQLMSVNVNPMLPQRDSALRRALRRSPRIQRAPEK